MSVETVPQDDGEIQDLVLMFANSRIPRGSDAFQTLIGDFLKTDETPDGDEAESEESRSTDSSDSSVKINSETSNSRSTSPVPTKSSLKVPSAKQKTVRMASPKPLAHVHWPDETNDNLASATSGERRHVARLYMKTTPKPILKHEEPALVEDIENT